MKISKKRTVQVMVFAIALLLVLALSIGISSAFYQAKRQASGTVIMDQGIIIDYKGFAEDAAATTWGKGVNLKLFTLTDDTALPGQQIPVNASSIRANVESVDFYARVKLEYKFYNVVKSTQEGVADTKIEVELDDASKLITTSESFFGANWVKSQNNDGWFYYGAGTALDKLNPSDLDTAFVALFADGAKFVIEGANFVGAENGGQGGGFVVNETTSINKIVVTLTLETLQGSADATGEDWIITPPPVVENFSSNNLTDASGTVLNPETTTLAEGTTYQVVDAANAGYKFTVTNSASGQAQTLGFDVSVVNGEATITGYTGEPTKLTIPDYITINKEVYKVTSIGGNAFKGCSSLTSITIPNSVTSIGDEAFSGCSGLTSITIPSSLTSIGLRVFGECSSLTSIVIPSNIESIGEHAFDCCGLTSITIPANVKIIGDCAFSGADLSEVIIENGVLTIGSDAFNGCEFTSIIIPDSVTSIGNGAFFQCMNLTEVTIGNGVTSIGDNAFDHCTNLTSINIPANVQEIGNCAFQSSHNLTTTIGEGWVKVSDSSAVDASTLLKDISYDIKRAEA